MIFVSVGTHKQNFDRLLKKIDELVEKGIIKERIMAQIGYTNYKPKHYSYKDFIGMEEFDKQIKNCSLFITHAGEGNVGTGLQFEKKMIVIARRAKYGEHTNDHQLEMAGAVKKSKQAIVCDVEGLAKCIPMASKIKVKKTEHAKKIIQILEGALSEGLI